MAGLRGSRVDEEPDVLLGRRLSREVITASRDHSASDTSRIVAAVAPSCSASTFDAERRATRWPARSRALGVRSRADFGADDLYAGVVSVGSTVGTWGETECVLVVFPTPQNFYLVPKRGVDPAVLDRPRRHLAKARKRLAKR